MSGLKQRLYDYLIAHDVDARLADTASDRCARAMLVDAGVGLGVGTGVGVLVARNPVVGMIIGTAGGVLGVGVGAATGILSASCEEVRNAALDMSALHL